MRCIQVGTLTGEKWSKMHEQSRRVYSPEGAAPTIHTMGGRSRDKNRRKGEYKTRLLGSRGRRQYEHRTAE